jgi:hypothetical protein
MSTRLYTIVCEFRGGTYVSQVRASGEVEAVRNWAERIKLEKPIPRASFFAATNVLRDLDGDGPVAIDGLAGVWCFTTTIGKDLLLANLVLS